jgi:hypothetical protein
MKILNGITCNLNELKFNSKIQFNNCIKIQRNGMQNLWRRCWKFAHEYGVGKRKTLNDIDLEKHCSMHLYLEIGFKN